MTENLKIRPIYVISAEMKFIKRKFLYTYTLILILFVSGNCLAGLKGEISSIINRSSQKKVDYGVYIQNARTGKTVYSHNSTVPMIPASNMKLVTTAAALDFFGGDYQFTTKVGICDNKLIIISSGDPLLGDEKVNEKHDRSRFWPLDDIVKRVKQNSITQIDGIITDTSVFDDVRVHPQWPRDQLNKWYACEISGLNFNNNCVDFLVNNSNGRIYYTLVPDTGYLNIKNQCRTISKGNSAVGAYRTELENHLILKGKVNKSARFTLALERPAGFFAYLLAENLIANGVSLNGQIVEGPKPGNCDMKIIAEYKNSIIDVIQRANRDSLGLAAESLLKKIGGNRFGLNGSWQSGADQISRYMDKIGVPASQYVISDGSGLSRKNRLSARSLVNVISDIYSDRNKRDIIINSLSVGGETGTASRWFRKPQYKGRIFVKTGYINGVRSYTGICKTEKGDFVFSIITNSSNSKSRAAMNDILETLIDYNN